MITHTRGRTRRCDVHKTGAARSVNAVGVVAAALLFTVGCSESRAESEPVAEAVTAQPASSAVTAEPTAETATAQSTLAVPSTVRVAAAAPAAAGVNCDSLDFAAIAAIIGRPPMSLQSDPCSIFFSDGGHQIYLNVFSDYDVALDNLRLSVSGAGAVPFEEVSVPLGRRAVLIHRGGRPGTVLVEVSPGTAVEVGFTFWTDISVTHDDFIQVTEIILGNISGSSAAGSPTAGASDVASDVSLACVSGELYAGMDGRREEIALYQATLADLGYDPGEVDGYFGTNTLQAATQEILDRGQLSDDSGVFVEMFPDDGAILEPAFERLGIACTGEGEPSQSQEPGQVLQPVEPAEPGVGRPDCTTLDSVVFAEAAFQRSGHRLSSDTGSSTAFDIGPACQLTLTDTSAWAVLVATIIYPSSDDPISQSAEDLCTECEYVDSTTLLAHYDDGQINALCWPPDGGNGPLMWLRNPPDMAYNTGEVLAALCHDTLGILPG